MDRKPAYVTYRNPDLKKRAKKHPEIQKMISAVDSLNPKKETRVTSVNEPIKKPRKGKAHGEDRGVDMILPGRGYGEHERTGIRARKMLNAPGKGWYKMDPHKELEKGGYHIHLEKDKSEQPEWVKAKHRKKK